MFFLGEYDEDEAANIRTFLSDAGIRVELKPYLVMDSDEQFCLRGRYSRLKEMAEDISDYEHDLSLIKSALSQSSTPEEFDELFLKELDPTMMKIRDEILAQCEGDEIESPEELSEESSEENSEDTSEESEPLDFNVDAWLNYLLRSGKAQSFAHSVLSLNGIIVGEPIGDKLDDPLLEIPADPGDFDTEPDELVLNADYYLSRSIGLYVDEFTAPLVSDMDEEFIDMYPDEYQQISALGLLIEKLATPPSDMKMSLDEFIESCMLRKDEHDVRLMVDGRDVFMELIRILERGDVLKSKGDKIKWKK
jgi:hypothetical protein